VPNTGFVRVLEVTDSSSSYWQGKAENDSLQRVYGISFRSKEELKEYKQLRAEAEKRDHRNVGKAQELFFFHQLSPGSCFFLPHGTRIYNKLLEFLRVVI
jgi:threonyl-tRNA synthetase